MYGGKDTWAGVDKCFRSKLFRDDLKEWDYNRDPLILLSPCAKNAECQKPAWRFSFLVTDDKDLNTAATELNYPMLRKEFQVEVEFIELKDFEMYNDEIIAVNLYVNEANNIKAWQFQIDREKGADVCAANKEPAADTIKCEKLAVDCSDPEDIVRFKAIKGGEFAVWAQKCKYIVASKIDDWAATQAMLDPSPPEPAFYTSLYDQWVEYKTNSATATGALGKPLTFRFRPTAKWVSNENKCYVGEH